MAPVFRVGLAAYGMSGRVFHAPFLANSPHFQLVKVCERHGNTAAEQFPGVQTVRSFEELLTPDIDVVVINTPNPLHYAMAQQAIAAGKHVVLEKPATATAQQAQALAEAAKARSVLLTVYQNRRWDGDFRTVAQLVQQNTLGEIVDYTAHFDRFVQGRSSKAWKAAGGDGVNILYDLGVHLLDQAVYLFGMPHEIYADLQKQRAETGGIDCFTVLLYYDTLKVTLCAGELVAEPPAHFAVYGRKGAYVKYGMDPQEAALQHGEMPTEPHFGEDSPAHYGILHLKENGTDERTPLPTLRGDYGLFYENLYEALTQNTPPAVTMDTVCNVLRLIEAAKQSNDEKRRIAL